MHESVYDNIEDEIIYIHSLGPKFFDPKVVIDYSPTTMQLIQVSS